MLCNLITIYVVYRYLFIPAQDQPAESKHCDLLYAHPVCRIMTFVANYDVLLAYRVCRSTP